MLVYNIAFKINKIINNFSPYSRTKEKKTVHIISQVTYKPVYMHVSIV